MAPKNFIPRLASAFTDLVRKETTPTFKPKLLVDVLRNQTAVMFFIDFVEEQSRSAYVHFWLTVDSFREVSLLNGRMEELANDAQYIYDRFLADRSATRIGIDEGSRQKLDALLRSGAPADVVFEQLFYIQKEVYAMLDKTLYQSFLKSPFYKDMQKAMDLFTRDVAGGPLALAADISSTPSASTSSSYGSSPAAGGPVLLAGAMATRALLPTAPLKDYLTDPLARFYFLEYMARARADHMVTFWLTVERYAARCAVGSTMSLTRVV